MSGSMMKTERSLQESSKNVDYIPLATAALGIVPATIPDSGQQIFGGAMFMKTGKIKIRSVRCLPRIYNVDNRTRVMEHRAAQLNVSLLINYIRASILISISVRTHC